MSKTLTSVLGRRSRISIGVLIVLGIVVMVGWRSLNAPAVATITSLPPTTAAVASQAKPEPAAQRISNAAAAFSYPGGYKLTTNQPSSEPKVYSLVHSDGSIGGSSQLAITIATDGGPLANNSAYRLRQMHPETYHSRDVTVQGMVLHGFITSSTESGAEQVVFWQHGSYVATVAATAQSSAGAGGIAAVLQHVLDSWQWQQ